MVTDAIFDIGKKLTDILLSPFEEIGTNEGLTEKNLQAVLESKGVSDFLLYRYYEEVDDIGIYTLADGRKGFILRIFPPGILGENTEELIVSILSSLNIENSVLQFITFSSQNIKWQVDEFKAIHPCQVNVKNRGALKEIIEKRAQYLQKWSRESFAGNIDLRIRDLVNLVCVLFPQDTPYDTIITEYESLFAVLEDFFVQNFPADDLVTLLREFFHNEKDVSEWDSTYDNMMALNHQITSGGVEVRTNHKEWKKNFVINDKNYVTVLTTKQYPRTITLSEFNELFFDYWGRDIKVPIGGPFICSLTIVIEDIDKIKDRVMRKLKHDLSEINKYNFKTIEAKPSIKERRTEVKAQLRFMEMENEVPLRSMWTLILFDTDKRKLQRSTSNIKTRFRSNKDWHLIEESFNNIAFMEALFSLPLQYHPVVDKNIKRFRTLFKSNNSSIAPMISESRGLGRKIIPFLGRTGQLQWFDPFVGTENYNIAIMGSSGAGKSFTIGDIATMLLASNTKVRIIDALASYKRTCQLIGGKYIEFEEDETFSVNFFTNIMLKKDENGNFITRKDPNDPNKEYYVIDERDFATIIPIIGMMCGVNVAAAGSELASDINTTTKTKYLAAVFEEAVNAAFKMAGRDAGMYEVREYIGELMEKEKKAGHDEQASILRDIYVALYSYGDPQGKYYHYFNAPNNVSLDSDFVVTELQALKEKGEIYPIVLMSLANQIVNEFFHDHKHYKMLLIDEFWMLIDNAIVMAFTEELARKVRKAKGLIAVVTQSIKDYYANRRVTSLYNNCTWKIAFEQPASAIDMAMKSSEISLPPLQANLLKTVHKRSLFGEFAIFSEKYFSTSRLKVDPLTLWLYTTAPHMKDKIEEAVSKYNISEIDAARFCAAKEENPNLSDEEVLNKIGLLDSNSLEALEKKKQERFAYASEMVQKALHEDRFSFYIQEVQNKEGNVAFYEFTTKIKGENKDELSPLEYLKVAKKLNLLQELEKKIAENILKIAHERDMHISLNITYESFLDEQVIDFIKAKTIENDMSKRLIIEVPLGVADDKEFEKVDRHIKSLKEGKISVLNDNVDIDIQAKNILMLKLDYIKIDSQVAKNMLKNSKLASFVELIVSLAKINGMKTVMVHISDEYIYKKAKEVGIDYLQGYYIGKPKAL